MFVFLVSSLILWMNLSSPIYWTNILIVWAEFKYQLLYFLQKNVSQSTTSDPSFLRMIMLQVLKRIVPQPVPSDFSASEYVAGDIMALSALVCSLSLSRFWRTDCWNSCSLHLYVSYKYFIEWTQLRFGHMLCFLVLPCLPIWEIVCQIAQWYVIIFISGGQALEVQTKNFAPLLRSFATGSTRAAEAHQIQCMIAHPNVHLELRFVHLSRLTVMYFKILIFGVLLISLMWCLINFLLRFSIIGETKLFHC